MNSHNQGLIEKYYSKEHIISTSKVIKNLLQIPLCINCFLMIIDNRRYFDCLVSKVFLQREGFYYYLSHSTFICDETFNNIVI